MSDLFERLNAEIELLGKKAHAALDEGKLRIELLKLRRDQDAAARELGLLAHGKERGGEVDPLQTDAQLIRLDGLEQEISRVERELARVRGESVTVSEQPAPTGAAPGEVEVVEGEKS